MPRQSTQLWQYMPHHTYPDTTVSRADMANEIEEASFSMTEINIR